MFLLENSTPNYVIIKDIELTTDKGPITFMEGESVSLSSDSTGNLFIGDVGTILKFDNKTTCQDLLDVVIPASFSLKIEEDTSISLVATENKESKIRDFNGAFEDIAIVKTVRETPASSLGIQENNSKT